MKTGWLTKRLGEVCEIINGKNQSEVTDPSGAYPIYGSGGIMGRASAFRCPAGCTVIGRKGSINNPLFVDEKFWNVDTAYALSPVGVEPKYLFYFCRSYDFSVLNCGTTIPSLTTAIVKDVQIPVPPLAEQKRIVAKIDAAFEKIDKLKANAERNLANAKELFQSALNEAMRPKPGWVEKRLGEIGSVQTGSTPSTRDSSNFGSFIPFVKPGDITTFYPIAYRNEGLSEKGLLQTRFIPKGSVLMVCIGASIGKVACTNRDCATNQQINALSPSKGNDGEFIAMALATSEFQDSLKSCAGQATLPIVSKTKWESLRVYLPSLEVQQSIVSELLMILSRLRGLQSNYTRLIADCAEMRQAVLKEAFEGRV